MVGVTNCSDMNSPVYPVSLARNTRGVKKIRGQMLPFPQFLTEQRETFT